MSSHGETGKHERDLGPAGPAPEADSAEQRTDAAETDERGDWQERVAEHSLSQGSEADVVEQAMEAGVDDEDEQYR